jgi:hypothetical protein
MNSATHDYVLNRCFKAHLLEFQFVPQPVLEFREGRYDLRDGQPILHPLEYFLLIEDGPLTGEWVADLQHVLGVSSSWVGGFVKGFEGEGPLGDDDDHLAGHRCGFTLLEDLRRWKRKFGQ